MSTKSTILYQKFITNVRWNALSALYYQTVLVGTMVWLFQILPTPLYGLLGALFALLYLLVEILDLGFDGVLASNFQLLNASRSNFKKIFLHQQFFQISLLGTITLLIMSSNHIWGAWFSAKFSCLSLVPTLWCILGALVLCEGILKDLRALAQLWFLSDILALVQVLGITIYTSLTLVFYYINNCALSLTTIFAPLLVSALVSLIILSWALYRQYLNLPIANPEADLGRAHYPNFWRELLKQRSWVWLNQLSKLAFNGNFLLTMLASMFGVAAIAPLKLTSRITAYLRYVLYHSLGLPIRSLLAQAATPGSSSLNFRLAELKVITPRYQKYLTLGYYFLLGILISFGLILFLLVLTDHRLIANFTNANNLIFGGILLLDSLFIAQEQYLLVTSKLYYLVIPNLLTIGLIYFSINNYQPSLNSYLISLALIRIGEFLLINLLLFKKVIEKRV